ncbi:NAD-dependent epimerase/dehydratase family protein [Mycobacterium avium]|uniref:NAD-dependent epimerase/dehydratase family protein n=1 Tax=Mycobacterium avium TaxID=1764 RepID=UPI000A00804E|nr:NAD-dependent epimerase/dehydratase family protein [Mycobacterium avium]
MRVFATGATGLVGAHTVLALLDAGHEMRLLVRDEPRARRWFESRGQHIERFVTVDITDQAAVQHAMAGCDAVFHAAASVSLDPRKGRETYDTNVGATRAVLGAAHALGIGKMLYVSSVAALFHPGAARVDESTPLADVSEAYSRTKRDSEEYVRELQQRGLPVQITYPVAVVGPDDPKLSAANRALATFVGQMLPRSTTGFQCVDVRDLAQAHQWLLAHPPSRAFEDARYIIGGHFYAWDQLRERLEALLGRRIFSPRVSPRLIRAIGTTADRAKKLVPFETQISAESMAINTLWPPADSSRFVAKSGLCFRPGEETLGDTIRWMVEAGHIPVKKAGRLGTPHAVSVIERHGAP